MAEYVVRHGESEANRQGVYAGRRLDSPLTGKGRRQARVAGEKLKSYQISKIVSSPMKRAFETAEIISKELGGLEILQDERLSEIDLGELTGRPPNKTPIEERFKMPGVEDPGEFAERTIAAFLEHAHDRGNTLFVAHGGTIRVLEGALENPHDDPVNFHNRSRPENSQIAEVSAKLLRQKYKKLETGPEKS